MNRIAKRLDAHFVACAAAGVAMLAAAEKSQATIVYSGLMNLNVNNDFSGVYIDLVTHAAAGSSFATFDTNPFYGGGAIYAGSNGTMGDGTGLALNLALGTQIGTDLSSFYTGTSDATVNFTPGVAGIYGVGFFNETQPGSPINFGWVRIIIGEPPFPGGTVGTIVDWAYEDSGASIQAGATAPAPGSLALLALGAVGLTGRRRK